MCLFHNINDISYNQQPLKCICAKFGDPTFSPRFYSIIFQTKSRFTTFLPELPQKYSRLEGLSQTLLMTFIINNSLSVLV